MTARTAPCPCGSGRQYRRCSCGAYQRDAAERDARALAERRAAWDAEQDRLDEERGMQPRMVTGRSVRLAAAMMLGGLGGRRR